MSYSEFIGKVVGEDGAPGKDGKTYTPKFVQQNNDNTIHIVFSTGIEGDEDIDTTIELPYIQPYVDAATKTLKFEYHNCNPPEHTEEYDLENLRGRDGSVKIQTLNIDKNDDGAGFVDESTEINIINGSFITPINTNPVIEDDVLYVLQSENAELSGDTYLAEKTQDGTQIKWTRVTDFIDISQYTKNADFQAFKTDLNNKINCIVQEQADIQKILREGIDTDIETPLNYDTSLFKLNLNTTPVFWVETIDGNIIEEERDSLYEFIKEFGTTLTPVQNND